LVYCVWLGFMGLLFFWVCWVWRQMLDERCNYLDQSMRIPFKWEKNTSCHLSAKNEQISFLNSFNFIFTLTAN
jgi:hypothetical protein